MGMARLLNLCSTSLRNLRETKLIFNVTLVDNVSELLVVRKSVIPADEALNLLVDFWIPAPYTGERKTFSDLKQPNCSVVSVIYIHVEIAFYIKI